MKQLTITKPDDWHLHLRDGLEMRSVVGMTAKQMGRAIIMPNLSPPIKTSEQALLYREEIIQALPNDTSFSPLMTLYLTDNTTQKDIIEASNEKHVYAVKLYPAGATTNSDSGVTNLSNTYPVLEQMQKMGFPLLFMERLQIIKLISLTERIFFWTPFLDLWLKTFLASKLFWSISQQRRQWIL